MGTRRRTGILITFAAIALLLCIAIFSVSYARWEGGAGIVSEGGVIESFYVDYQPTTQKTALESDNTFDKTKRYAAVYHNSMLNFYALTHDTSSGKDEYYVKNVLINKTDKVFAFKENITPYNIATVDDYSTKPLGTVLTDFKLGMNTIYCLSSAFDGWYDLYFTKPSGGSEYNNLYYGATPYVDPEDWGEAEEQHKKAKLQEKCKYKAIINYVESGETKETVTVALDCALNFHIYVKNGREYTSWPGSTLSSTESVIFNIDKSDKENLRLIINNGTNKSPDGDSAYYFNTQFPVSNSIYYIEFDAWNKSPVYKTAVYTPKAYPTAATPTRTNISYDRSDDLKLREVVCNTPLPQTTYTYHTFICISRVGENLGTTLAYVNFKLSGITGAGAGCKFAAENGFVVRRANTDANGNITMDASGVSYNPAPLIVYNAPDGKDFTAENVNGEEITSLTDAQKAQHMLPHVSGGTYAMLYFGGNADRYYALDIAITTTTLVDHFDLSVYVANADWRHKYVTGYGAPLGYYLGGTFNGVPLWDPREATKFEKDANYDFPEKNVSLSAGSETQSGPSYLDVQKEVRLVTTETVDDSIKLFRLDDENGYGTRIGGKPTLWFVPQKAVYNWAKVDADGHTITANADTDPRFDSNPNKDSAIKSDFNTMIGRTGVYFIRYAGSVTYFGTGEGKYGNLANENKINAYIGTASTTTLIPNLDNWNAMVERVYIGQTSIMATDAGKVHVRFRYDDNEEHFIEFGDGKDYQIIEWAHTYRESGNSLPTPSAAQTPADKVFDGWYTDAECTAGNEFSYYAITDSTLLDHTRNYDKIQTSDITLYAKWKGAGRTVTLNANGGTFSGDETTTTLNVDDGATIPAFTAPTRTGNFAIAYWYTKDASDNETEWDLATNTVTSNGIVLYAKWQNTDKGYYVTAANGYTFSDNLMTQEQYGVYKLTGLAQGTVYKVYLRKTDGGNAELQKNAAGTVESGAADSSGVAYYDAIAKDFAGLSKIRMVSESSHGVSYRETLYGATTNVNSGVSSATIFDSVSGAEKTYKYVDIDKNAIASYTYGADGYDFNIHSLRSGANLFTTGFVRGKSYFVVYQASVKEFGSATLTFTPTFGDTTLNGNALVRIDTSDTTGAGDHIGEYRTFTFTKDNSDNAGRNTFMIYKAGRATTVTLEEGAYVRIDSPTSGYVYTIVNNVKSNGKYVMGTSGSDLGNLTGYRTASISSSSESTSTTDYFVVGTFNSWGKYTDYKLSEMNIIGVYGTALTGDNLNDVIMKNNATDAAAYSNRYDTYKIKKGSTYYGKDGSTASDAANLNVTSTSFCIDTYNINAQSRSSSWNKPTSVPYPSYNDMLLTIRFVMNTYGGWNVDRWKIYYYNQSGFAASAGFPGVYMYNNSMNTSNSDWYYYDLKGTNASSTIGAVIMTRCNSSGNKECQSSDLTYTSYTVNNSYKMTQEGSGDKFSCNKYKYKSSDGTWTAI